MTPRRSLTMKNRLFLAFGVLALAPLVAASWMAVATTSAALRDKIGTYSQQLVGQLARGLDGELKKIRGITDEIVVSPEISGHLVGYRSATASDQVLSKFLFGKLLQRQFLNVDRVDDVLMVFPGPRGPEVVHTAGGRWDPGVLGLAAQGPGGLGLIRGPEPGQTDLVLVRPLRNALADDSLGTLLVVLDPDLLTRVYRDVDMGPGAELLVVDPRGTVVSSRNPRFAVGAPGLPAAWLEPDAASRPFLRTWEGQEHLFSLAPLGTSGWTMVGAVPSSYLDSETGKVATQVALVSVGALVLALLVSLPMAEGFTAPLRNLERTMGLFGEGMMQARSAVGRDDELGRLQRTFNAMATDITGLLARIDEEHRRRQLTELQVLEYQINPHFLYNTLDSIHWMARRTHQDEIGEAVTALARFFRLSLSQGQETYRVRDEVDHVKAYLAITRMRFPDSFVVEYDVDEALGDRRTLKIVLQPLVENALKHGLKKRGAGGRLRVVARGTSSGLEWTVEDNGRGMDEASLAALRDRLASGTVDRGPGGFGLVNVGHRIRLNYGPAYGLAVASQPGVGTVVTVRLPWLPDEDENSNKMTNL